MAHSERSERGRRESKHHPYLMDKLSGICQDGKHLLTHSLKACSMCDQIFYNKGDHVRHIKEHAGEFSLQFNHGSHAVDCDQCTEGFSDVEDLEAHLAEHKSPCEESRKEEHHRERKLPHTNQLSSYFKTRQRLKLRKSNKLFGNVGDQRKNASTGLNAISRRAASFPCDYCEQVFSLRLNLTLHLKTHEKWSPGSPEAMPSLEAPDQLYKCNNCPKRFSSQNVLNRHRTLKHKCDKRASNVFTKGRRHVHEGASHSTPSISHHYGKKLYFCSLCQKECKSSGGLKLHRHIKHQSTIRSSKHQCKECDISFETKKRLFVHMQNRHGASKRISCQVCGSKFNKRSVYIDHINSHKQSDQRSGWRFACKWCGLQFSRHRLYKMHLYNHKKTVTVNEEPTSPQQTSQVQDVPAANQSELNSRNTESYTSNIGLTSAASFSHLLQSNHDTSDTFPVQNQTEDDISNSSQSEVSDVELSEEGSLYEPSEVSDDELSEDGVYKPTQVSDVQLSEEGGPVDIHSGVGDVELSVEGGVNVTSGVGDVNVPSGEAPPVNRPFNQDSSEAAMQRALDDLLSDDEDADHMLPPLHLKNGGQVREVTSTAIVPDQNKESEQGGSVDEDKTSGGEHNLDAADQNNNGRVSKTYTRDLAMRKALSELNDTYSESTDEYSDHDDGERQDHDDGERQDHDDGERQNHDDGERQDHDDGERQDHDDGERQDHDDGERQDHDDGERQDHDDGERQDHDDGERQNHDDGERQDHDDGERQDHDDGERQNHDDGERQDHDDGERQDHDDGERQETSIHCERQSDNIGSNPDNEHPVENMEKHSCTVCHRNFNHYESMKRHMVVHGLRAVSSLNQNFQCRKCKKSFSSMNLKLKHEKIHERDSHSTSSTSKRFTCKYCGRMFFRLCELGNHVRNSTYCKSQKKCKSSLVKESTYSSSNHVRNSTRCKTRKQDKSCLVKEGTSSPYNHGANSTNYKSQKRVSFLIEGDSSSSSQVRTSTNCETQNQDKLSFAKEGASTSSLYLCSLCGRLFKTTLLLFNHSHRPDFVTSVSRHKACALCLDEFSTPLQLQKHLETMHDVDNDRVPEFSCKQCDIVFDSKVNVAKHKARHKRITKDALNSKEVNVEAKAGKGKPLFVCRKCGQLFSYIYFAYRHGHGKHQDREVACSLCYQVFTEPHKLKSHVEAKHVQREMPSQFPCSMCHFVYDTKSNLHKHKTAHTDLYSCKYCLRPFTSLGHCDAHVKKCPEKVAAFTVKRGEADASKPKPKLMRKTQPSVLTTRNTETTRETRDVEGPPLKYKDTPSGGKSGERLVRLPGITRRANCRSYYKCPLCALRNFHRKLSLISHLMHDHGVHRDRIYDGETEKRAKGRKKLASQTVIDEKKSEKYLTVADKSEENASLKCMKCKVVFTEKKLLAYHIKQHIGEAVPTEYAHMGAKSSRAEKHIDLSQKMNHSVISIQQNFFACNLCESVYTSAVKLRKHLASHRDNSHAGPSGMD